MSRPYDDVPGAVTVAVSVLRSWLDLARAGPDSRLAAPLGSAAAGAPAARIPGGAGTRGAGTAAGAWRLNAPRFHRTLPAVNALWRALVAGGLVAPLVFAGCGGHRGHVPPGRAGAAGRAGGSSGGEAGVEGGAAGAGAADGRSGTSSGARGGTGAGHSGTSGAGGGGTGTAGESGEAGSAGAENAGGTTAAGGTGGIAATGGGGRGGSDAVGGAGTNAAGAGGSNAGSGGAGGSATGGAGAGGNATGGAGMGGAGGAGPSECVGVAPDGDDAAALASAGSRPFATLQAAIDFADAHRAGPHAVCVAQGAACGMQATYAEPSGTELTMRDGIAVTGDYESTTWSTCTQAGTTLEPGSARGVYFGPSVTSATALSHVSIRPFAAPTTAGITFDGARGASVASVALATPNADSTTLYGVDALNGADASAALYVSTSLAATHVFVFHAVGATLHASGSVALVETGALDATGAWFEQADGSTLAASLAFSGTAAGIGIHASESANLVLTGTSVRFDTDLGLAASAIGAELLDAPGATWNGGSVSIPVGAGIPHHGLILVDSPGATLVTTIGISGSGGTGDALSLSGDATGTQIGGSISGALGAGTAAVVVSDCGGSAPSLQADVTAHASTTSGAGILVDGDCAPAITGTVTLENTATNQVQTLAGVRCTGAARCTLDGATVRIVGNTTTPGAQITATGVDCDAASCVTIRDSDIRGLSAAGELRNSRYHGGGVVAPGATLVSGNLIDAGCSGGDGVGLRGSGRIENNVIWGPSCGGSYLDSPLSLATALEVTGSADVHSNTLFGGGAADGVLVGQTGCSSVGVTFGDDVSLRNNIVESSAGCLATYAVHRSSLSHPPSPFEHNDLVSGSTALYVDDTTNLTSLDAVNALPGAAGNLAVEPSLTGYHLAAGSPCIDAGTTTGAPSADIDGDARADGAPDIGADEALPSPCAGVTCAGHGTCVVNGTAGECVCDSGYETPPGDPSSCANIDECASENGGCDPLTMCNDTPGSRTCGPCPAGYSGTGELGCKPLVHCSPNPCQAGAACFELASDYACACPGGLGGKNCDVPFTAVAVGDQHVCGLRPDGSIECWGSNSLGQAQPPPGTFALIRASGNDTCALATDGTVACFGDDTQAQASPPAGTFKTFSLNGTHGCAVRSDDTLACWGSNVAGEGTPPGGTFEDVAAGGAFTCGVRTDGTLACWGDPSDGQTAAPAGSFKSVVAGANHACALALDDTVTCWGADTDGQSTPPSGTFARLTAAGYTTCGLHPDGTVACWGYNAGLTPTTGTYLDGALSLGGACAVKSDGEIACWAGLDRIYPPGAGFLDSARGCRLTLTGTLECDTTAAPSGTYVAIAHGTGSPCAILGDGSLACWGFDPDGRATPPPGTFVAVATGDANACGVRTNGSLACWGSPSWGVTSPPAGSFTAVGVGSTVACGLDQSGALACWGAYVDGLAHPPPNGTFTALSVGYQQACAVATDGSLACWGESPLTPPSGSFVAVTCGAQHCCALHPDGTAACFGDDSVGQATPPAGAFTTLAAAGYTTCGVRPDATDVCWGATVR